ncbi:unnamed protein product [Phytophthora lilii]|uniref:Unnamed protein product n=1 Tax=Phytophthora lilii TaxID=2077276 RepID=A0A9W6U420_9STRA|nr:unnamed protein product [Phytophthora lilii]
MEPSFVANPYVQASAPSSRKIREILDREEASYKLWRKTRKQVLLPYASKKLNSPLKLLNGSNQPQSSKAIQSSTSTNSEPAQSSSSDKADHSIARSHSDTNTTTVIPPKGARRKGALTAEGFTRSMEVFPSLSGSHDNRQKLVGLVQGADAPLKEITQVFSYARCEDEGLEDAHKRENSICGDMPDDDQSISSEDESTSGGDFTTTNNSARYCKMLPSERQSECILNGLGFLSEADYDSIFESDWKSSEAEKTVRDAVDRKRIREILRRAYRILLWFFRYYAGNAAYAVASERRGCSGAVTALGEELFEIPSRVRLLEDLNVQCVDAARFGVTDSPLKRESLISFLLNVARMMCTHSSNPNHLRMVISEGIEMSDAVKTLVHDHFGVFAQIQDVDHFRFLFLRKPEAFIKSKAGVARRLQSIIEIHKNNLANFFDEIVSAGGLTRSGGANEKAKNQVRHRNGLVCTQFLSTLRAISLIISRGAAGATNNTSNDGDASVGPTGVDEVRAVRIFLSCLPMTMNNESSDQECTTTASASSSSTNVEPRELTLQQFTEALLRVAFTWKELQICNGSFDVCPNQMTSDCCQCTLQSAHSTPDKHENEIHKDEVASFNSFTRRDDGCSESSNTLTADGRKDSDQRYRRLGTSAPFPTLQTTATIFVGIHDCTATELEPSLAS